MKKKIAILLCLILIIILTIFVSSPKDITQDISKVPENTYVPISYPGDFSCQPNECEPEIKAGINGVAYPGCNPLVQINETGASNKLACDYWRIQEEHFGEEDYVDLSTESKNGKASRGEPIVDGFLGMNSEIIIHRNAVEIYLKAESKFNELYGANRNESTYFLPSYPDGYTFEFSGSINKRGIRGNTKTEDTLTYEGQSFIPSNHFWGAAIDFNSENNWGNRQTPGQCSINIPPEVVTVFESSGLRWGGRYFNDGDVKNYMDPMHFEYVPECIRPTL